MREERTIRSARLLCPLLLGLGLALALLWVLAPSSAVKAQSTGPGFAGERGPGQPSGQSAPAAQAVNPGFTLDLAHEAVWGMLNPGDVVTAARTNGGAAYGAAEADGVGFFWTPLWQSNGQPADIVGSPETIEIYVNGALAATMSPLEISGQVDVLNDRVSGNVSGLAAGTSVTVTLGEFGRMVADVPRVVTTVDGSGDFSADLSGVADIGPHEMAQVQYRDANGNTVQGYVYPSGVFRVDSWHAVLGYAAPGAPVTVTIYMTYPTDIAWDGQITAQWPHGTYAASDYELGYGDVVEVDLGGGTVISTTASYMEIRPDAATDQITGQAPAGAQVRGYVWDDVDGIYDDDTDTADGSGNYTLNLGVDFQTRHWAYVAYADAEGDEVGYVAAPPHIRAHPTWDYFFAQADFPNQSVTYTLDTGTGTETRYAGCDESNRCDQEYFDAVEPGHVITAELSSGLMMAMTVPSVTLQADTANDGASGDADIPGRLDVFVQQWQSGQYPIHGTAVTSAVVSSPFAVTFPDFDVRDGIYLYAIHYDANGHYTLIYRGTSQAHFEVVPTYNSVGGVPPSADEPVTGTLYTAGGAELVSTSDDHDGNPWYFWLGDFQGYDLEPGRWVTVTSASGWEAGLQIPELSVQADADDDLIWGEGPKSLLFVEHSGGQGWDGRFVPVDDYALDQAFFGRDVQWGDWIAVRYVAPNGNRVQAPFPSPDLVAHYRMDGSNDVWGSNAVAGNTIYITITDELGGLVDAGTTYPGSGDQGPTSYYLEFPDGSIVPSYTVHADFGNGYAYSTTVVSLTGQANVDSEVVTITAPISAWVYMNANGPNGWWDSNWSYGSLEVGASGYVTFDLSVDGYDIVHGTEFNVHVEETQYTFWLPAPELSINKWHAGNYARPGGVVVYGIQYNNDGNGSADVLIVDTLPMSTTWAGDTSGVTPDIGAGGVITWDLGELDPGDWDAFMVTLNVVGLSDGESLDPNCAVITSTTPGDYDLGNNGPACSGSVDVWDDEVEIEVNKWPNTNDPTPGQEFDYTVQWCNWRGAAAGPVLLTDTLPLSTTFVRWSPERDDQIYWNEVLTTGGQLVLSAPGLPGDVCEHLHLTLFLDPLAPISTTLTNKAVITVAGDVDTDNNERTDTSAHVSPERYDVYLDKSIHAQVPVPGGWINYFLWYQNQGNAPVHVWITDTVPQGLSYDSANWGGGQPQQDDPFPAPTIIGDQLVWDLGEIAVNESAWFHVQMDVDDGLSPGAVITPNCASIGITETESTPWDNLSCSPAVTLNVSGPNLRVTKRHWWNGDGQLGYEIHFENIGDETASDVWITDTLPLSTAWDGWWDGQGFDWGRLVSDTQSSDELRWNLTHLNSGDSGWLYFNANLDTPGQSLRWYTNTVEITTPPTDVDPDDNVYHDVAFSGGEVDWIDLGVYDNCIWGDAPQGPITVTTPFTQVVFPWDGYFDWCFDENLEPGDTVVVEAGAGIQPVVIEIPDPFYATADSSTDTVWGQIDALDHAWVEVQPDSGSSQNVQTDGSGNFSATFPDIPRGGRGEVRYYTEIDYADVTFHRRYQTTDLILKVNYAHDWVNGNYEAGHTVWITVTESDSATVKATAVLTTGPIPWWGGESGFEPQWDDWWPVQPDIEAGDWVFGLVDNGQATQLRIGEITGTVDVDNDSITGRIYTPWFSETLYVRCDEWAGVGAPGKDSTAGPDGDPPYYCEWDPDTEWDVQPGQEIGVWYQGSDLNWVAAVFREPQPYLRVEKWANGNPGEGGNLSFSIQYWDESGDNNNYAEDVVITDTLLSGMTYITDTSGFPHSGDGTPADPLVWELGTLPGNVWEQFDVFVEVTAVESDTLTNTVQITTSSPYNQSSSGERYSEWSGHVGANDTWLGLNKYLQGRNPAPGTNFVWAVNACNNGSTASSEVVVTDTLPISTTLLEWWGQNPGWSEVLSDSERLVVSYPSLPDGWCSEVYLRFHLDEEAWIGMWISNTATMSASNDLAGGSTVEDWRWVSGPYSNLYVRKDWLQGQLAPGGELSYQGRYGNDGNAPVDGVLLTYTLPASTTFNRAGQWDQYGSYPFIPAIITADYVVWDLGTLENGNDSYFEVRLDVDSDASPGTLLSSTLEITPHPSDYHHDDNIATWVETLNSSGPNLEVHKQNYWWNGNSQIGYEMRIKNRGDERLENVWITDTYPISTTWNWDWNIGHGPWITVSHDAPNRQIVFWVQSLDPGETASVDFRVDLDYAISDTQGLFFTNTLSAPISGDVYPADNDDQVVAYAGPDVYAEKWLREGEPRPGNVVTFTVKYGNRNGWDGIDGGYGSYVTDTLPVEMAFITATTPWDPNQHWYPDGITGTTSVRWGSGTPWSNSAYYFAVVAQITDTLEGGDVITNVIQIHDENPSNLDLSSENDVFELPITILNPKFEIGKVYKGRAAGATVTYTLTITNVGSDTGSGVLVTDTVPAYLSDVNAEGGTFNLGWIEWVLGPIAPGGGAATARFSATLPCTAGLSIVNDDYGVRGSDQGVSGPAGAVVSFDTIAPTISAGIAHTPEPIVVGDTVYFTATASSDGAPLGYAWDLGDGATASGLTTSHVYTQDGSYTVVFTATDACGYSEVLTTSVTVDAPDLVAAFEYSPSPANIVVNNTITFTDTSTTDGPPIVAWAWTFGDSGTSNAQNPSHLYTTVGTYTVSLVVTDALGYSDDEVKTDLVVVVPSCVNVTGLSFDYAPAAPVIQSPVVFTASVTGGSTPIAYAWQFDDGGSDSGQTVTHTFTLTGTHTVTVTASNACSAPTYSDTVDVAALRVFLPLVLKND